jgi:hypothetical protein
LESLERLSLSGSRGPSSPNSNSSPSTRRNWKQGIVSGFVSVPKCLADLLEAAGSRKRLEWQDHAAFTGGKPLAAREGV